MTVRFLSRTLLLLLLLLVGSEGARADTVNVGVLSFDVVNPGAVNAFTVGNSSGAFSLSPDFPVSTSLAFLGTTLILTESGAPASFSLGDIDPGASQLSVLDTASFSAATLDAQISQTLFTLADGTNFQADTNMVTATLLPSSGSAF